MATCKKDGCETFSRKLRGQEIHNLEKFNLSKDQCREILHGTIRGLCPLHAANELADDFSVPKWALRGIETSWDTQQTDNFRDAYAYAQCSSCSRLLSEDRAENTPEEVRDILKAYDVPEQRVDTIVYLQSEAICSNGKCFQCCLRDPDLLSTEPCEVDNLDEIRRYRSSKWETRYNAAQDQINAIEAERGISDNRHQKVNDLQDQHQRLQTEHYTLKAEIDRLESSAKVGEAVLKKERFRTVEAYKLYCEVSEITPDDAKIKRYQGLTDLFELDRLANGFWELIHKAEGNEVKPIPARPSQPETPSESELASADASEDTETLPEARERAKKAYQAYMEMEGLSVNADNIQRIESSDDISMLTDAADRYISAAAEANFFTEAAD